MFDATERDRPQIDGPLTGIDPGTLDDDQLVAEVSKVASELAAGNARLLELIATAQERSLWSRWGALHPWQWVSCLTGFSPRLAKDQALVADKLSSLPKTHQALATGEISFCQASSIAKVERDDLEEELVTLAKDLTQGQLDTVLRAYRRASAPDDLATVNAAHDRRFLHYFFVDDSFVLKGRLSKDDGALVAKALDVERDELFRAGQRDPKGESGVGYTGTEQLAADALVELSHKALSSQGSSQKDSHQVMLHVDIEALSKDDRDGRCEIAGAGAIATETAHRLSCDAPSVTAIESNGQTLSLGRKTRRLSYRLRRSLETRDTMCRFPGCNHTRYLDAHHLRHWSKGGKTELCNLMLLCRRHHRWVHEHGYLIDMKEGRVVFLTPAGEVLRAKPERPPALARDLVASNRAHGLSPRRDPDPPEGAGHRANIDYIAQVIFFSPAPPHGRRRLDEDLSPQLAGRGSDNRYLPQLGRRPDAICCPLGNEGESMALRFSTALVALLVLLAASLPISPAAAFLWTCSGGGGDTANTVEIDRLSYSSNMEAGRALLRAVNNDSTGTATRFCINGTSGSGKFDIGTSILQPGPGDDIIGAPATSTTATVSAIGDSPAATAYDPDPYVHIVGSGRAIIRPTTGSHDNYFEWVGFAGATNSGVKQAGRGFDGRRMAGGDSGDTGIPDAWFFSVQAYGNDRLGLAGLPWGTLITRTEIKDNGGEGSLGTDSGGTKAANPYEVRQSYIHDNLGNGVWCDAGCVDAGASDMDFWVHDNVIARNGGDGVRYENSPQDCSTTRANPGCNNKSPRQSALIQHNRVVANAVARAPVNSLRGGVVINSARRAEVVNNRFGHGTIFGISYSSNQSNAESKNGGKGAAVAHSGSRTSLLGDETHHNAMASGNERYEGCGLSGVYCHDNTGLSTTVAAVGDIVCDPTSAYFDGDTATRCQHRKTLALVTGAEAVLTLGDHQYENGTRAKFDQAYDPSWGAVADKTFPSPGNHEYRDPRGDAAGYFGYWGSKGRPTGGAKGYYSWDISPTWHLVALNSSNGPCRSGPACGEGSAQNSWLEEDLDQVPSSDCILAYWHHPLLNSGANNGNENTSAVQGFWTDLYAAGADLILNGHEHNYQRYSKMTPDGEIDSSGVREIISGGGGDSLYGLLTTKDPGYQFGTKSFGVLKLELSSGSYSWKFVNLNGTVVDSGGPVSCHT